MTEIKISEVQYRKDLYPRFKSNSQAIQQYAENLETLPPIEVNQDNILIDGYHRWKAHETAKAETIPCTVTETESEAQLLMLAVSRNAKHGQQLTTDEKKRYCILWFDQLDADDICDTLSISKRTYRNWTSAKREALEEQTNAQIQAMYLQCYTQQQIADAVGMDRTAVTKKIDEIVKNGNLSDSHIFHDFEGSTTDSTRQIYTIWNIAKANNEVRHFGNIPPEIVDNLMYLYTKPLDVVFDPFGGGGSTLDMCQKRKRRCFISDLNPIPARDGEIRKHDITTGLPDMPVPALVFLDPPYWQQAKEKYSKDNTDLANIELEEFLQTIGDIAKQCKTKWRGSKKEFGTLALIIGPWKENGKKVDLPFLCYERISKYLPISERIIVPYSTQVHGGAYVKMAKEQKQLLYLHRDLMVFQWASTKE